MVVCMKFDIIVTGLLVREGGYYWSHVPPPMVSTIKYEVRRKHSHCRDILCEFPEFDVILAELVKFL